MIKIYALIINGLIVNTIKADDNFITYISNDFDQIIDITNLEINPGIEWTYNSQDGFRPPKPSEEYQWNYELNIWEMPIV